MQRAKCMFITIILYYCVKQRVPLMNKIYTDRMISSKQCCRRTMKNQPNKLEVNIYSLPSLVTSHGIQDTCCPRKVNSITYPTFIQVLVSLYVDCCLHCIRFTSHRWEVISSSLQCLIQSFVSVWIDRCHHWNIDDQRKVSSITSIFPSIPYFSLDWLLS